MQLSGTLLRYPSRQLLSRIDRQLGASGVPLRVRLWTGETCGTANAQAELAVRKPRALFALAHPNLGALARSYVEQDIDVSGDARSIIDLAERLCAPAAPGGPSHWNIKSLLKRPRHTRSTDRRAISYHYDVSNDFYRLWLDERMTYSCAYFWDERDSLDKAQLQKLDHICRKLMLRPGERFLDIGCGWGALVMHAARHYGVRALGVTVSRNQYEHANAEIRRGGLQDRCEVVLMDYRDIPETAPYDKVASVGMFEHVGIANFPVYFGKIHRLLKPGGLLMNHGITSMGIDGRGGGPDFGGFMDEYVFPDGELAHVSRVIAAMAEQGLECVDTESLRTHYAKTLWHWVGRLESESAEAVAIAGETRYRVWRIYMAGCAWCFERGWLSVYQLLAGRPDAAGRLPLPMTREYMYESRTHAAA